MKNPLRKLRISINTFLTIVGVLFVIGFLVIRTNLVGQITRNEVVSWVEEHLQTKIELENIDVTGFNIATMGPLTIYDQQGDTLLYARRVMASYDMLPLLARELKLNTIQLIDFELRGKQEDIHSEPNFRFLLDALTPKTKNDREIFSAFGVNAVFLRQGRIRYDIQNVPHNEPGQLDIHHLDIRDLSASMSINYTPEDGAKLKIKRMTLNEQCGLTIHDTQLSMEIGNDNFLLLGLKLSAGASSIHIREANLISNPLATIRAVGKNLWLCDVNGVECEFATEDLAHIIPQLGLLENTLSFSCQIHATSDSISFSPCILSDQDSIAFDGQLLITTADTNPQLKWIDQKNFFLDINNLQLPHSTTKFITQSLQQIPNNQKKSIYEAVGALSLNGTITGNRNSQTFEGHIKTQGTWQMLPLKTNLSFSGNHDADHHYYVTADGTLPSIIYRGYLYNNVRVKGQSSNLQHALHLVVNDENLGMTLTANLDRHKCNHLQLDANVDHFRPDMLNLSDEAVMEGLCMSFQTNVDLEGNNLEDLIGNIEIENISLNRGDSLSLELAPISIEKAVEENNGQGIFQSEFLNFAYEYKENEGHRFVGWLTPSKSLMNMLLFPANFTKPTEFALNLNDKFHPTIIDLELNDVHLPQGILSLSLSSNSDYEDGPLKTHLSADLISTEHKMSTSIHTLLANNLQEMDVINGIISIDNIDFNLNRGYIARNELKQIVIENLVLQNEQQQLKAQGILAENEPGLNFNLNNFEIRPLLSLLGHAYLDFGGSATGDISISNQSGSSVLSTRNLQVENFSYIGTTVGRGNFVADYDIDRKRVDLDVRFRTKENRHSHVTGWIQLAKRDSMDLKFDMEKLPIDFIDYWVGNVLQEFKGYGTGEVRLFGACKSPNVSGNPYADVSFTHSFLGTRFQFKDNIELLAQEIEDSRIKLNHVSVSDGMGHNMRVTAEILHDHLSHFRYNVDIDIPFTSQGFMVFNHPVQENGALYWGRLFATGQANLQGGDGIHNINVNMQTADHSIFYLSPGEDHPDEDNGKYQLLTYRAMQPSATDSTTNSNEEVVDDSPLNLNIELNITATEKCQVYVQMDPLSDDHLISFGRGDLTIHYDPRSDIRMSGNYNMSSGSYTMTMSGDLLTKEFSLLPTSSVHFSGPPSQAELNWDCRYSIPSVNLTDLDQSFASLASMSRTSLPVDCKMKVSGPISQPVVSFDLEVKSVSDDVQALVHNLIGTPEMLNQEVFYLLLFSRFYTPSYAQAQQNHSGSELSSFASSSITSQLNSLLGRMSDNFTLGTNFRSERGDFTDMEMDLAISTRLFSNRLLINGNLGYRDPSTRIGLNNNTNSFIGDFDAEYLINQSGTIRAKAYSHYNERDYSINNALTTQGLGIVLMKDFRTFMDLWKSRKH